MANRRFDNDDKTLGVGLRRIYGSFVPLTGAGIVAASTVKGMGFGYAPIAGVMALKTSASQGVSGTPGIVRTSTGLYTITLEDSYLDLVSILCSLQVPAAGIASGLDAYPVTLPSVGVAATASTFQIVILNSSGVVTESVASCRICFEAVFRDSSVQFNKP